MPNPARQRGNLSAWAAFGILAAATAVSGAIAGSSIGETGMLYRSDHSYALPESPLVRAKQKASHGQQYVARTMIVDGRQVGFDPYAMEDYDALEAEYAAMEPVDYLPVDGYSSVPGMQMAATDTTAQRAQQIAERVERMTAKVQSGPKVTVMRGTERSVAPVEPVAAPPAKTIDSSARIQATNMTASSTQSSVVVTDG